MVDDSDSTSGTEKMSAQPGSESSSVRSLPVPVGHDEIDLEKTESRATQHTTRSSRSNRTPVTAQDWDGEDDPDNPLNWPVLKKIYHTSIPALQCFTM